MNYLRIALAIFIFILLFTLSAYQVIYQDEYDPDIDYRIAHFDEFENATLGLTGEIKQINATAQRIIISVGSQDIILTVSLPGSVEGMHVGDIVEISGVLDSRSHVTAQQIVHFPRWKFDLIYIRSLPAIPFVLYFFFRRWRFDRQSLRFQRRDR